MSILRDKILNSDDIAKKIITIPQWKTDVEIRELTAKERASAYSNAVSKDGKTINFEQLYVEIVITSAHDPKSGDKIFEKADKELLLRKSGSAVEKIARTAMKLSGMDDESAEEIEKNL